MVDTMIILILYVPLQELLQQQIRWSEHTAARGRLLCPLSKIVAVN